MVWRFSSLSPRRDTFMTHLTDNREESLGEFLADRARSASDDKLAWQAIGAVITAVAIAFWRGPAWDIRLALMTCLLAYGLWGIADRDLANASRPRGQLFPRAIRALAAVCGFGAAAYLMLALLGRALGKIIS